MIIYKLTFATGKVYIGQTIRTMDHRISHHRSNAIRGSMLPVHCAWRLHGDPLVETLGSYANQADLNDAEVAAIKSHNSISPNGYNIASGGGCLGQKHPETIAKMSTAAKARRYSDDTKAKLAEITRDNWANPDYRAKVEAGVAASFTEERRAKIGAQSRERGLKAGNSHTLMMRAAKGPTTEETRAKMSASAKARKDRKPMSEDTKRKLGSAIKLSHNGKDRGAAISAALRAKLYTSDEIQARSDARKRAWETRRARKDQ